MRHARPEDLDQIDGLLAQLRALGAMKEKKRGSFSLGSKGFLHFHEDAAGMFADVKLRDEFERFRVSTKAEQAAFVRRVKAALKAKGAT